MSNVSIREFGSLEHDYPVIEVYVGEALAFEIVTTVDKKVEILPNAHSEGVDYRLIEDILKLVLPAWLDSLTRRDIARRG